MTAVELAPMDTSAVSSTRGSSEEKSSSTAIRFEDLKLGEELGKGDFRHS